MSSSIVTVVTIVTKEKMLVIAMAWFAIYIHVHPARHAISFKLEEASAKQVSSEALRYKQG